VAATGQSALVAVAARPASRRRLRARRRRATWRPVTRPEGPEAHPDVRRRLGRPSWTASFSWPSASELPVPPSCDVCEKNKKTSLKSNFHNILSS